LAKLPKYFQRAALPFFHDGCVIFDSLAIIEYANELRGHRLLPAYMKVRARARSLLAWVHSGMSGICSELSFESTFADTPARTSSQLLSQLEKLSITLDNELASHNGPYLAGELSLADLAFVPVMIRLQRHQPDLCRWPLLGQWQERLLGLSSVREWMREAEKLPAVVEAD
jgi:glutathione S-transferase